MNIIISAIMDNGARIIDDGEFKVDKRMTEEKCINYFKDLIYRKTYLRGINYTITVERMV
jgi:hypothetical protein